jgi:hypothetical protein
MELFVSGHHHVPGAAFALARSVTSKPIPLVCV